MNQKSKKIADLIAACEGQDLDPHYVCYFECFNRGLYYEAHEVLERLWLPDRKGPNGSFYKGLIQLAGAFVHLQRRQLRPSAALFKLAQANLRQYPGNHGRLNVGVVLELIESWLAKLEAGGFVENPLLKEPAPKIHLTPTD